MVLESLKELPVWVLILAVGFMWGTTNPFLKRRTQPPPIPRNPHLDDDEELKWDSGPGASGRRQLHQSSSVSSPGTTTTTINASSTNQSVSSSTHSSPSPSSPPFLSSSTSSPSSTSSSSPPPSSSPASSPPFLAFFTSLLRDKHFIVAYAINQLGSAIYLIALSLGRLSHIQPLCNAVAFAFTAITSHLTGETQPRTSKLQSKLWWGVGCVLLGTYLCLIPPEECTLMQYLYEGVPDDGSDDDYDDLASLMAAE